MPVLNEVPGPAQRPIRVVEPQMEDVHHAPFNAALLHAVALAWPGAVLSFQAFAGHIAVVRSILDQHAAGLSARIVWRETKRLKDHRLLTRILHGRNLIRGCLATKERLLFSSISRLQLLLLKRAMSRGDQVYAVLHGDLDQIERPSTQRFPSSLISLERILLSAAPAGLRYVLLGKSIQSSIPARFRLAFKNAPVIDHPYHFPPPSLQPSEASPAVILGTFGNTGDGRMLEQVAGSVRTENRDIRFRLVGFLSGPEAVERLRPWVEDVGFAPISRTDFQHRASSVTHALWLAGPDGFRLRASGTFFDALAYAKPLIYTANAYIDSYYSLDPSIGIRCELAEQVPDAILKLASELSPEQYESMRQAILRLRERFTPQAIAVTLPSKFAW